MTTRRRMWVASAVVGLALLFAAGPGWAACCKCTPCIEGPAIACFSAPATRQECELKCPFAGSGNCGFDSFAVEATCGQGEFADCTSINGDLVGLPAPAMGAPAVAVTAIGLLLAGAGLIARRTRPRLTI